MRYNYKFNKTTINSKNISIVNTENKTILYQYLVYIISFVDKIHANKYGRSINIIIVKQIIKLYIFSFISIENYLPFF